LTPASVASGNFTTQAEQEVKILKPLQTNASTISLEENRVDELDEKMLRLEEVRNFLNQR
jgi:hypothetical protein